MYDSLWKALKKLPLLPRRLGYAKAPALRFLDLPEDIVYEIVHHLDIRSLCNLSLTCRQLYLSLLIPHLHQQKLPDPFREIHLNGDNCTAAIPALRLLLYDSPIKAFTWRAGHDPRTLVREVEQLRRLIARMSAIEYLELDFSNNWPANEFRHGHENGYWAWVRLATNLLHVVAQRCRVVVVTNHYQVLVPWVTFIGGVPYNLDPPLLARMCAEWRASAGEAEALGSTKLMKSPSKISLSHPDNAPASATFPQPFPPEKGSTVYATRRLIVNDPGLFQRSLFGEWALDWVSNMPLTHLVIHQGRMRLPLLRQLRLPRLTSLVISHGYGLSTADIVLLLQNNEALSSVDFLDTKLDVSSAIVMLVKKRKHSRASTDIGFMMERVKGSASLLRGVLDLELAFLRLKTVVVQVRGDGRSEQGHTQKLLRGIGGRENVSNLVFELPPACERRGLINLEGWLAGMMQGSGRKELVEALEHVRLVHLHYPGTGLVPKEVFSHTSEVLAGWTSLFSSLCEIRLTGIFDLREAVALRDFVRRVSPNVTIRVDGTVLQQGRVDWNIGGRTQMD